MSTHRRGKKWVVRWREDGGQRALSFETKLDAVTFDRTLRSARAQARQAKVVREALERAQSA